LFLDKETAMKTAKMRLLYGLLTIAGLLLAIPPVHAKGGPAESAVPVTMTVTATVAEGKRMPEINREDVVVKRGKERLRVTSWAPAQGERAGMDLFILVDDATDSRLGSQLNDLQRFINRQPATTAIGIGYIRNGGVQVAQQFTTDHARAAQALRLPLGHAGAYSSPYLSVIDLMNRWPATENRREIVMITDGIDRAHRHAHSRHGLSTNPDVETASAVAQRTGTMIHTIYAPGVGRWHRNYFTATSGQTDMARLSGQTGGEAFYLGLQSAVSFGPYLDELQRVFDNQYLLSFAATPGKKSGLQCVTLSTEVPGVHLSAHNAVWVPGKN
jgi:hypothetical protein